MLQSYARYYNEIKTHRSLNKDAPLTRPVQRSGHIVSHAMVGGLHHQYVRIRVFGTHRPLFEIASGPPRLPVVGSLACHNSGPKGKAP